MEGGMYDNPARLARYSVATPAAPSNPLGMFAANFANNFVKGQENQENRNQAAGLKEAFLHYQMAKADPNSPLNQALIAKYRAQAASAGGANGANGIQFKQDKMALDQLTQAEDRHSHFVNDFVKSNLGAQTMNPTDPRYAQMLAQANSAYFQHFPADQELLKSAPAIRANIFSRNPGLKSVMNPGAPAMGAAPAPAGAPPMGAPAPRPAAPMGAPPPNMNNLPAPMRTSMAPAPQPGPNNPEQPNTQVADAGANEEEPDSMLGSLSGTNAA